MDEAGSLEEHRQRWNVPDWRRTDDYAYVMLLEKNPHALRWEFLRRMKYYRSDWDDNDDFIKIDFGLHENFPPWLRGDELRDEFCFMDSTAVGEILFSGAKALDELDDLFTCGDRDTDVVTQDATAHVNSERYDAYERDIGKQVLNLLKAGYVIVPFIPIFPAGHQTKIAKKALITYRKDNHLACHNKQKLTFADIKTRNVTLLRALDVADEFQFLSEHPEAFSSQGTLTKKAAAEIILKDRGAFGDENETYTAASYLDDAVTEAKRLAVSPISAKTATP